MILVLLAHWAKVPKPGKPTCILELFAGRSRLSKLAAATGLPSQAHDLLFDDNYDDVNRKSFMDINSPAGFMLLGLFSFKRFFWGQGEFDYLRFGGAETKLHMPTQLRLAILSLLDSAGDELLCLMGIKCSSWVGVNVGTSQRTVLNPMGWGEAPSVACANKMVSRPVVVFNG